MESNLRSDVSSGETGKSAQTVPHALRQAFTAALGLFLAEQGLKAQEKNGPPLPLDHIEKLTEKMGHDDFHEREDAFRTLLKGCTSKESILAAAQGWVSGDAEIRRRTKEILHVHKDVILKEYPEPKIEGYLPLDMTFFFPGTPVKVPPIFHGAESLSAHQLRGYYVHKADDGSGFPNYSGAYKHFLTDMHGYNVDEALKDPARGEAFMKWREKNPAGSKNAFLQERFKDQLDTGKKRTERLVQEIDATARVIPVHIRKSWLYLSR